MRSPLSFLSGMDFIVFGILCCIGPIGFYNHMKEKLKKDVEERMPDFLRDIANSTSSGMTIFDAIKSASEGEYGKLTKELQMMSSQLSWGVPIKDALDNFANRVNTNELKRLSLTVNKALEIGGNTSAVFNSAAKEIDQMKRVEKQRKTEMSMYSIVIFISLFVFIAVILIVDKTIFAAMFDLQGQMSATGSSTIGGTTVTIAPIDTEALKDVFYVFMVVQSIGGGILGGFMMDGRLSSGVRFGFILVLISFFIFKIVF
jgi:flagellar protein FlaJ